MSPRPAEQRSATAPGPGVAEFEACTFDVAAFDHRAHVFVAWQYLLDCQLATAIQRYARVLRRLTASLGVPEKYHETITWFFLIEIAGRLDQQGRSDWETFERRNPDLVQDARGVLTRRYSPERLASDAARRCFLLPDRSAN